MFDNISNMLNKAGLISSLIILSILLTPTIGITEVYSTPILKASLDTPDLDDAKSILVNYHKDSESIDKTIDIIEVILQQEPENIEALNFLSRVWLTFGHALARSKQEMISSFEKGLEVARKSVELAPDNPDSHFYYVANLASLGEAKGIFNSLFMLPEVRKELDMILELDPNHAYGLAMNGALYYFLPGILGGDIMISETYIRRSLSLDPHMSSAKFYLALNLRKQKRYDEAIEVLLDLVNDKNPSFYPDWYLNRKYALVLISQIEEQKNN